MTLLVCRTCPRYQSDTGSFLQNAEHALAASGIDYRVVQCVGGCNHPGNIALDAPGKARVRISGLTSEHFDAILTATTAHHRSATGIPDEWQLPDELAGHITAVTPKSAPPPVE